MTVEVRRRTTNSIVGRRNARAASPRPHARPRPRTAAARAARSLWPSPTPRGGDAQRPLAAVRLRYFHPAHRRRAVDARTKVTGQLTEHPADTVILHRRHGHPIDPGAPRLALTRSRETSLLWMR